MNDRDTLHAALEHCLGTPLAGDPTGHVNDALTLAGLLEDQGYGFRLRDARPKDPTASLWKAVFTRDGRTFAADDPNAAMAVCRAALDALRG